MSKPESEVQQLSSKEQVGSGNPMSFFDVDGTITKGLAIRSFAVHLQLAGLFNVGQWERMEEDFAVHKAGDQGKEAYRTFAIDIVDHYGQGISGQQVDRIQNAGAEFFEKVMLGEIVDYTLYI